MKKVIIFILFIGVIAGLWFFFGHASKLPVVTNPTTTTTSPTLHPDASNATFIFEDETIKLTKGAETHEVVQGGAVEETTLTDTVGYGDLNNDKKEDSAITLVQSGGGSGVFIYIAGYVSGSLGYKGTNAIFVGDRIEPKSITIQNGIVTFTYLDRKSDEPLSSEPTVRTSKTFAYTSGVLIER